MQVEVEVEVKVKVETTVTSSVTTAVNVTQDGMICVKVEVVVSFDHNVENMVTS